MIRRICRGKVKKNLCRSIQKGKKYNNLAAPRIELGSDRSWNILQAEDVNHNDTC